MKSREEIYDVYLTMFASHKKIELVKNPFFVPTLETINKSISKTEQFYMDDLPEIVLTDEEKDLVIKRIESIHSIYQEEGHAILGDYEHDYEWYNNWLENNEQYYWNRYKNYLVVQRHFSPTVIDVLENKTLKSIMSYIGDPNQEAGFSIRGLVVGDVQSGKTSNYLGLIAKAADAGYKVIFILTGTIESLRKQTQQRVEEGFVGYNVVDGQDVGVGRGEKTPISFTSIQQDFVAGNDLNTTLKINSNSSPMVFVLKKNVSVLKKLYSALKNINTTKMYEKITSSLLLIDDEADNASINTNKDDEDPTKINNYIRKILSLFEKSSYVGFTATPFANVFIGYDDTDEMLKDDLFPRDFIYALNSPSNYCGAKKYFLGDNNNIRYIKDSNDMIFPMNHNKYWNGSYLFSSVYHAINTFLIANTIRDLRDVDKATHRSMLINMTRFTNVQLVIKDIVEEYFKNVKNAIKQTHKLDREYALTNTFIKKLKNSFEKEFKDIVINGTYLSWDMLFNNIYDSIKDIEIVVINSSKQSKKLNYENYKTSGLRVIAIGGLALSRGLTLEGLCVSYFYRNSSTFDVLMQMGRWFGYRDGYEDLCRIFITQYSADYYRDICASIEDLRDDIRKMGEQHKKPADYGIKVRNDSNELGITANVKMRHTQKKLDRKSFYGNVFETPYLHRDLNIMESNIRKTHWLLDNINISQRDYSVHHPYFRNVPKKTIIEFLSGLKIHEANENFDLKQLIPFLNKEDNELEYFDVLIMEGDSTENFISFEKLNVINSPLVKRGFDVPSSSLVRISQARARLGGRLDPKNGLSESQATRIGNNAKAQDYMVEGRNPLLIIYFIQPKNEGYNFEDEFSSNTDLSEELKLYFELKHRDHYPYLVGYGIGFPHKEGCSEENVMYTVNKTVNYFAKDHEKMEGDDCNE